MSYIQPNSTIILYDSVPLDPSYRNTLYFGTATAQQAYFLNSAARVATLERQSYQRVNRESCKVQLSYDRACSCNYMAFRNTDFENKWFYAFITDVNYINDTVSEIVYQIDLMQSYLFDVELLPCFVEREHIDKLQDTIGANIQPEHFNIGEYIHTGYKTLNNYSDCAIIIGVTSLDTSGNMDFHGNLYDGTMSGLTLYAFAGNLTGAAEAQAFINANVRLADNLVTMYMCPLALIGQIPANHIIDPSGSSGLSYYLSDSGMTGSETFGTYTPVNKKLYTYPYNYHEITNGQGETLVTRYEFYTNNTPTFTQAGTLTQPVSVTCRPRNYKGVSDTSLTRPELMEESISLRGFPLCSWTYDSYQRWISTRVPQLIRTGVVDAASTALSSAINPAAAGGNLLRNVTGLYEEKYNASLAMDPAKGSLSNANPDFAHSLMGFWASRCHITPEQAQIIDEFFSVFGYQTNLVKVPNRSLRNYWNYVKTRGCLVEKVSGGKVSAADIARIESIYDNGITFWKDPALVGQYTRFYMERN